MESPLGKFEFIIRVQYVENWENECTVSRDRDKPKTHNHDV